MNKAELSKRLLPEWQGIYRANINQLEMMIKDGRQVGGASDVLREARADYEHICSVMEVQP